MIRWNLLSTSMSPVVFRQTVCEVQTPRANSQGEFLRTLEPREAGRGFKAFMSTVEPNSKCTTQKPCVVTQKNHGADAENRNCNKSMHLLT